MSSGNRQRLLAVATLLTISLTVLAQKENMETIADTHHLSAYIVAALMIGVFVMIFSNRLFYYRQREVSTKAQQQNSQLGLVLTSQVPHRVKASQNQLTMLGHATGNEASSTPCASQQ